MFTKLLFLLSVFFMFSCASKPKKYTLVRVYKEHQYLHDNAKPIQNEWQFTEKNDKDAYAFAAMDFSLSAGSWNDTALWNPIEPISFQVIDRNNNDIKNFLPKDFVVTQDSLMAVSIKEGRAADNRAKQEVINGTHRVHGGLADYLDSVRKINSKSAKKK